MKKFFTSKPFVISALAVLCIGIVAACLIWGRDKPSEFTPDPQESQTTDEWKDNSSSGNGAESWNTPGGAENQPDEAYPKVVEETEDEVVVDFTAPKSPDEAEPPKYRKARQRLRIRNLTTPPTSTRLLQRLSPKRRHPVALPPAAPTTTVNFMIQCLGG